jgi:septum formation protein
MPLSHHPIILASASRARAAMLEQAGVEVIRKPAIIDEDEVKHSFRAAGMKAEEVAEALAELKAERIARRHASAVPSTLIVGADQMLECDGVWFDKPTDRASARTQLQTLRGKQHRLFSCAVVLVNGQRVWHHTDQARLHMRALTDRFIDAYLDAAGDTALQSVGAYQLEGLGAQLFARIEGDFFTILGMPLLPLLDFLRVRGVLPT